MVQFFAGWFGPTLGPTLAYLSLMLIVVAIAVAAWFAYRFFGRSRLASGKRNRQTRLGITDVAMVDKHRRLVLLRRDEVEHLIMIGGQSDLVIESDIRRNAPARPRAAPEDQAKKAAASAQKAAEIPKPAPTPSKTPEKAPPVAKSPLKPETAPAKLPPLKLQEEAPKPAAPVAAQATKPPTPPPPMATTASTVGAVSGALGGSAALAVSALTDTAMTAKNGLAMPATAKPEIKEGNAADEAYSSAKSQHAGSDPKAIKEMDALLEELAVPKK